MYTPTYAKVSDQNTIKEFIKKNSFGILVVQSEEKPIATHIPLEFSSDDSKLFGHISKANPQWKYFAEQDEVLAIFSGPHAYISSSWYDHENVPTWNYIAAHVYGRIKIMEDKELYEALTQLMNRYEGTPESPVPMERMSAEYVRISIQGLVGFEISITSIQATYKLSQNRDYKNQLRVIQELEKKVDPGSLEVALQMKKNIAPAK